jgi:hypothetical protein
MAASRRVFLGALTALVAAPKLATAQPNQARTLPLPNKATFQSGDLIWPKKPGDFVPYRAGERGSFEDERQRWDEERARFLESVKRGKTYLTPSEIQELRSLDFREFYARYAGDQMPNVPGSYSSAAGIYVGHVGLIDLDTKGEPWVIEALWGRGVVRQKYDDWISGRPGEIVWHGRLRDLDVSQRARVVPEARKHIGKPYNFWNFDLNDEAEFYCSKLVWLSIFRSLEFAVDGKPNPKRGFWFSPKQLLYAKTIARLHDPGAYASS